jgi:hypothetical protein
MCFTQLGGPNPKGVSVERPRGSDSNRDSDRGRFSLARVYHLAAILRTARDPAVVGSVVDVFRTGLVSCERFSSFSVLLLKRGDEL